MKRNIFHLALGGTFDHLHKGHKEFLNFAIKNGTRITIGITSDAMVSNGSKSNVENLSTRIKNLKGYLVSKKLNKKVQIIVIDDIFGSTLTDQTIDGLVVTNNTLDGARLINEKRVLLGLDPLDILICPLTFGDDKKAISSSQIRDGIIDRNGFNYLNFLKTQQFLKTSNRVRNGLKKPLGKIYKSFKKRVFKNRMGSKIITVGDFTTQTFIHGSIIPNLSVIDFKIKRNRILNKFDFAGFGKNVQVKNTANHPGGISAALREELISFFTKKQYNPTVIKVDGEEDLAVLPIILLAPLGTFVYYGQPNKGLVEVEVDEAKKKAILLVLKKFDTI